MPHRLKSLEDPRGKEVVAKIMDFYLNFTAGSCGSGFSTCVRHALRKQTRNK